MKNFSNAHIKPTAKTKYDFVQLFVRDKSQLEKFAPKAVRALKEDGLFWISYPKKSSAVKTDLSRDHGWDIILKNGFDVVSLIAIDNVWSALRFRKAHNKKDKAVSTDGHDAEARIINPTDDLNRLLKKYSEAKVFFDTLSYTNRKEYVHWITSAKKVETRAKRLQETVDKLLKGMKNPSQK